MHPVGVSAAPVISERGLARWCERNLGAPPAKELFRSGHLSLVIGLGLADGRDVVVKVRAQSSRLRGCVEVQRRLASAGFPCPTPITDVSDLEGAAANAETLDGAGADLPTSGRAPAPFAGGLALLIAMAPAPEDVPPLDPAPPWTAWNHDGDGLWPAADDYDGDLNSVGGPAWIDAAGAAAWERLSAHRNATVVGHGDWYTGNLRWDQSTLHVVHDWDSVLIDTEAAIVGFAAGVYPTVHAGSEASVTETEGFITHYVATRGREFTDDEVECAWAAGVWLRAFDSKKQFAKGQAIRSLTEGEAAERLLRAGVGPIR